MATGLPAATEATTPSHRSAATMTRAVINYVQGPSEDSELQAVALDGLNSGIAMVNGRKWNKITSETDLTLAADTSEYGVPADFKEPMALYLVNSSNERVQRVPFKTLQTLLAEHPDNTTSGQPHYYAINYKARQVMFSVACSSAFVSNYPEARLYYYRRLADLTSESGMVDIGPEFDWFLIWQARVDMAAVRDPAKMAMAERQAGLRWRALIRDDTDQMTDWAIP